jgi:hypothetical protein
MEAWPQVPCPVHWLQTEKSLRSDSHPKSTKMRGLAVDGNGEQSPCSGNRKEEEEG